MNNHINKLSRLYIEQRNYLYFSLDIMTFGQVKFSLGKCIISHLLVLGQVENFTLSTVHTPATRYLQYLWVSETFTLKAFASVHCCLLVTCWERARLFAHVGDVYCIFVTFPCGILGQVWCLIVLFPDLCRLSYFLNEVGIKV